MPALVLDVKDERAIFSSHRDQARADERLALLWRRLRLQIFLRARAAASEERP